jgi:hypothetical protein
MAKKKKKRTHKVSKGLRQSISRTTVRLVRDSRTEGDKYLNKLNAWKKGKKGFVTIRNPNPSETDRPYIKVSFDQHFGGAYKDVKHRVRPSEDRDRIEL